MWSCFLPEALMPASSSERSTVSALRSLRYSLIMEATSSSTVPSRSKNSWLNTGAVDLELDHDSDDSVGGQQFRSTIARSRASAVADRERESAHSRTCTCTCAA